MDQSQSAAGLVGEGAGREDPVIMADNIGKRFKIYQNPWWRLAEWVTRGRVVRHKPFWAVRGVSFEVRRGECLGIIGANGAGKSTLLKVITGALQANEGACHVRGRLLSLIELGTGINKQLTGRQNVFNVARLLALPAGYAKTKIGDIEAFAELGEFFDRPVHMYSSGMRARLNFSMFAAFQPDVFIVDEVLSVGDVFFRQKCAARIREMLEGDTAMLFVSHDTSAVLNLCSKAIVLEHGRVVFAGPPEKAVARYQAALKGPKDKWKATKPAGDGAKASDDAGAEQDTNPSAAQAILRHNVIDDSRHERVVEGGALRVAGLRITNDKLKDTQTTTIGGALSFHMLIEALDDVEFPTAGIVLHDRLNNAVFGGNTISAGSPLPPLHAGQRVAVSLRVKMDLAEGKYSVQVGASRRYVKESEESERHDLVVGLGPIDVRRTDDTPRRFWGMVRLPHSASHEIVGEPAPTAAAGTGES